MSYEVVITEWFQLVKLVKPGMLIEINSESEKDNSYNFILFLKTYKLRYLYSQNKSIYIVDWYQSEPSLSMVLMCPKLKVKESREQLYFYHKNNRVSLELYHIEDYISNGIKITVLN